MNFTAISFEWKIAKRSLCMVEVAEKIKSSRFFSLGATWELWLYPKGTEENAGNIVVSIIKLSSKINGQRAQCKIALKNENDLVIASHLFEEYISDNVGCSYSHAFMQRNALLNLLLNDLIVCFDMVIKRNIVHGETTWGSVEQQKYTKSPCSIECFEGLSNKFSTLYGDKKSCDVTLKAEGKEFLAHKAILGARSSVFQAMFQHDMQEKRNSVVDISDLSASILDAMLWYIYSGKVSNVDLEKAMGLFTAADKYALDDLKTECSRYMIANLSTDNFCEIAELADSPGDDTLMDAVKHFFCGNTVCILKNNKWRDFVRERSHLTSDLFEAIFSPLVSENNQVVSENNQVVSESNKDVKDEDKK